MIIIRCSGMFLVPDFIDGQKIECFDNEKAAGPQTAVLENAGFKNALLENRDIENAVCVVLERLRFLYSRGKIKFKKSLKLTPFRVYVKKSTSLA